MLKYILDKAMLKEGDRVIAGISGGADSVCLLHLLVRLSVCLKIEIEALHVNHGIRGAEAERDERFVKEMCEKLDVPYTAVHVNVPEYALKHGISEEEAGRILRYEAFRKKAEEMGGAKIAVAHHKYDSAETILHNLFRGSGLKGLGGIEPVRGNIVRPLLECSREDIVSYLKSNEVFYCEDSTNFENEYTRNKIRNRVIPMITSEINSGAVCNIIHAGKIISQADAYFEKKADEFLALYGVHDVTQNGIPIEKIKNCEMIICTYIIKKMICERCNLLKDITSKNIEQVCELIKKPVGKTVYLPYSLKAYRDYDYLWIKNENILSYADEKTITAPVFSKFSYEKHMEIPKKQYTKWFDYDKIKGTLSVRTRETGDYIMLPSGGKKTVKSFMIDEKILREKRDKILLLADGSHIIWIIGYRISEYYKVTENTKNILQVEMNGGNDNVR